MTEAGIITSNPLHGDRIPGSVGFALSGVQMRISDDGRECDPGEVGIVEVAGTTSLMVTGKTKGNS